MVAASIIMPTYDKHIQFIEYSVKSVLRQTITDYELFIIGDGTTDKMDEVINNLVKLDNRIKFVKFPKMGRTGEPHRHEVITKMATGKYIFYLASDDIWLPEHMQCMIQQLVAHKANYSYSDFVYITGSVHKKQKGFLYNKMPERKTPERMPERTVLFL